MDRVLTGSVTMPHTARVGRKPIIGAVATKINLTPEDIVYIDAVKQAYGLGDRSAALRFAVRELARRDRLKVEPPVKPSEGE